MPNPTGPLCELSSPAIAAANAAVNNLQPRGVGGEKARLVHEVGRDENQERKILQQERS